MNAAYWLDPQLGAPYEPGLWVAGSLVLAAVASNLAWLYEEGRLGGWRGQQLLARAATPALTWALASLFLLLVPAMAWQSGAISPFFLGLSQIDWPAVLGAGGLLSLAVVGGLLLGWSIYRRDLGPIRAGNERWLAPLQALLWQWHWAFYRAAAITWLAAMAVEPGARPSTGPLAALSAQPVYWGSWLGLGLAGLEAVLNPYLAAHMHTPGRFEGAVRTAALAVATTALFSATRNFWLCAGCHLLVELVVAAWLPGPAVERDQIEAGEPLAGLAGLEPYNTGADLATAAFAGGNLSAPPAGNADYLDSTFPPDAEYWEPLPPDTEEADDESWDEGLSESPVPE